MARLTSPETALLEAIYDRFDDPAPRLAWADGLDAQRNPWGAVVRAAVDASARRRKPGRAAIEAEFEHAAHGVGARCGVGVGALSRPPGAGFAEPPGAPR